MRRSGHTIRVTAQLINAVRGFHLWSQTYDRDLGDVLKLQTEIATAVASALKVALLGDVSEKIELGGTRNPEAFDAYLRGRRINWQNEHDLQEQIASYSEAIKLDPQYALAYAARSSAYRSDAQFFTPGPHCLRPVLPNMPRHWPTRGSRWRLLPICLKDTQHSPLTSWLRCIPQRRKKRSITR